MARCHARAPSPRISEPSRARRAPSPASDDRGSARENRGCRSPPELLPEGAAGRAARGCETRARAAKIVGPIERARGAVGGSARQIRARTCVGPRVSRLARAFKSSSASSERATATDAARLPPLRRIGRHPRPIEPPPVRASSSRAFLDTDHSGARASAYRSLSASMRHASVAGGASPDAGYAAPSYGGASAYFDTTVSTAVLRHSQPSPTVPYRPPTYHPAASAGWTPPGARADYRRDLHPLGTTRDAVRLSAVPSLARILPDREEDADHSPRDHSALQTQSIDVHTANVLAKQQAQLLELNEQLRSLQEQLTHVRASGASLAWSGGRSVGTGTGIGDSIDGDASVRWSGGWASSSRGWGRSSGETPRSGAGVCRRRRQIGRDSRREHEHRLDAPHRRRTNRGARGDGGGDGGGDGVGGSRPRGRVPGRTRLGRLVVRGRRAKEPRDRHRSARGSRPPPLAPRRRVPPRIHAQRHLSHTTFARRRTFRAIRRRFRSNRLDLGEPGSDPGSEPGSEPGSDPGSEPGPESAASSLSREGLGRRGDDASAADARTT